MAGQLLCLSADLHDFSNIDPGLYAKLVHHVQKILRGDIAGSIRNKGAAPQSREGGVKLRDARLKRCDHVRETEPACRVKVQLEVDLRIFFLYG